MSHWKFVLSTIISCYFFVRDIRLLDQIKAQDYQQRMRHKDDRKFDDHKIKLRSLT